MKLNEDIALINTKTGEIQELDPGDELVTEKERIARRKYMKRQEEKKRDDYAKSRELATKGDFVWTSYSSQMPYNLYLSNGDVPIKSATITRLIYLATFLNYDGVLVDDEIKDKTSPSHPAMTKQEISKKLNLATRTAQHFFEEVEANGILTETNGKWRLSSKYFFKGKVDKDDVMSQAQQNIYIIRAYKTAIRSLYRQATVSSHSTLGYLFQIIPFVNRAYNIVCFNPRERDFDKIVPMTVGEFADILGYDRSNASRLYHILRYPHCKTSNGSFRMIRYVSGEEWGKEYFYMFVNPRIYYAGSNWSKVEALGVFDNRTDLQLKSTERKNLK